ncbi:MAG: Lrp/AsnC family transcriptional regulator [Gammaproteobacteria bacterium]|jgi:DNA-binding Lrp family transcriptional regulator|nr:Lrp/AsnC family transcriptional regulator [Gammaproteobacteria bacterium]NOQ69366.1 Lrp/AsnC family transcriptional regulator [Gammaproteobacteria bacterium]
MTNSINDFSPLEQHLLNDFQRDLSLSTTPYADMARQLNVSEEEVLQSIQSLQDRGVISRVGPVFRPNRIGVSTLAAMAVPEQELECVARIISAFPEVNHNYEREHEYNLWFVVTASSEEHLDIVLHEIEQHAEHPLMSLPMLDDYFIDLGFKLQISAQK